MYSAFGVEHYAESEISKMGFKFNERTAKEMLGAKKIKGLKRTTSPDGQWETSAGRKGKIGFQVTSRAGDDATSGLVSAGPMEGKKLSRTQKKQLKRSSSGENGIVTAEVRQVPGKRRKVKSHYPSKAGRKMARKLTKETGQPWKPEVNHVWRPF